MTNKLFIGQPVIICDSDRPTVSMVAVISHFDEQGRVHAHYLSKSRRLKTCYAYPSYVTPLETFGVELSISDGLATCRQVRPSAARYRDGAPRNWQPDPDEPATEVRQRIAARLAQATQEEPK